MDSTFSSKLAFYMRNLLLQHTLEKPVIFHGYCELVWHLWEGSGWCKKCQGKRSLEVCYITRLEGRIFGVVLKNMCDAIEHDIFEFCVHSSHLKLSGKKINLKTF